MKRALSFLLATLMLLTLTACGAKSEAATDYGEPMDDISYDPVTFSEYLAGGQRIWFYLPGSGPNMGRGVSKDASVEIYITQPDGTMVESSIRYSLGEMSQMTDEEIVAMVESNGSCQYTSYKLAIETDATGNHTQTEEICHPYSYSSTDGDRVLPDGNYVLSLPLLCDCGLYEIYQSYYDGFIVDVGEGSYFLTRVDKDIMFELDPVGTEGILVDDHYSYYDF